MNADNIECYFTASTDLDAIRCKECGSMDFECTNTRKFCIRCGLVVETFPYLTSGTIRIEDDVTN